MDTGEDGAGCGKGGGGSMKDFYLSPPVERNGRRVQRVCCSICEERIAKVTTFMDGGVWIKKEWVFCGTKNLCPSCGNTFFEGNLTKMIRQAVEAQPPELEPERQVVTPPEQPHGEYTIRKPAPGKPTTVSCGRCGHTIGVLRYRRGKTPLFFSSWRYYGERPQCPKCKHLFSANLREELQKVSHIQGAA